MLNISKGSGFFYTTNEGDIKGLYYLGKTIPQAIDLLETSLDTECIAKLEEILNSENQLISIKLFKEKFNAIYNTRGFKSGTFYYDDNMNLTMYKAKEVVDND